MAPALNFAELYCEQQGIPLSAYRRHIFNRALYPHARPLTWLLSPEKSRYFEADRLFVQDVARLTRYKDFHNAGMDYNQHRASSGFLRRGLRLRISTERMRRLVRQTFKVTEDGNVTAGTLAPFQAPPPPATTDSGTQKPPASN
jgi:hypothetical protein